MRPTLLLPLALISCASTGMDDTPDRAGNRTCSEDGLERFTGEKATQGLAAEMMAVSGAGAFRWTPENGAVTMDFRPDRLTVWLDDHNRVVRATCG